MLTEKILLAERRVSRLWNQIPGVMRWDYIRHSISEELFATNEMEGVRSTRKETQDAVDAADKARKDGDDPKARFSEFAKLYLNLTDKDSALPAGIADIRDIYDKVVLDEINENDKPDGDLFRKGDVEIQGPHGLAIHNGVKGEGNIGALLTDMIHLATSDEIPRLQSAIMSHFLFEYVHPFYDGNGRTGRYLLALYLNHDLTMPTVLSLSRTIAENKNAYYKAFMEAEDKLNCGELTLFVNTILGFIRKAQDELIDELEVRVDQLDKLGGLRPARTEARPVHEGGLDTIRRDSGGDVRLNQVHDIERCRIPYQTIQAKREKVRGRAHGRGPRHPVRETSPENTGIGIVEGHP